MTRALRLLAVLSCAACSTTATTASAADGTFTHVLCADPATGQGVVSSQGRLPDGTSNPHNVQYAGVSEPLSRCSGTIDGSGGVPVTTGAPWSTSEANKGAALRYRTPAGIDFGGGVIYRYGSMGGNFSWTLTRNGRWDYIFGTPADERCSWGDGCGSRGTPAAPWSDANRVRIERGTTDVDGFDLSVLCDIPDGWSCTSDGSQTVRVYGGRLVLEDRSAPVPGRASGSLVTADTLAGTADVDFSATDTGSGLYRVRVLTDGIPRLSRLVHDNGGRCADVDPANGDDHEFAWQQPCRASAAVSAAFDTRALPEGEVALKVIVEDAAGSAATIVSRRVVVDNVPPPTSIAAPSVEGVARRGSSLAAVAGEWDDHGAAGDPAVTLVWQRCGADGSACADIPGASGSALVLGSEDVGRRVRVVERAANAEGVGVAASPLTAVVTREDGTLPPDPGEDGRPGPPGAPGAAGAAGAAGPGGAAGAIHAAGSASLAPGSANGEGASPRARLTVAYAGRSATSRTVRYGNRAQVVGRLVDEHDRPIRNAIVDVSSQGFARGAAPQAAPPAITGADGTFTLRAAGRAPTRRLRFAYRWQGGGDVVSAASLILRVRAAVRLAVRLRGTLVRYSGRVLGGPLPRLGKLVVVQGRVRGARWQTFASRRATRRGRFRGGYRLKVRRPGVRLQFRARAVAESGWSYLPGTSRVVTRRVR